MKCTAFDAFKLKKKNLPRSPKHVIVLINNIHLFKRKTDAQYFFTNLI